MKARRAKVKAKLQREQPKTFKKKPDPPLRAKPESPMQRELRQLRNRVAGLEGGK